MNYCECGSIKEFGVCSNRHCKVSDRKSRNWIIDGRLYRFLELLTYSEAVEAVGKHKYIDVKYRNTQNQHVKPFICAERW